MKNVYILFAGASLLASCSSKPDYDATGIFEAITVTVSAETTGKILSISAEEGDSVTADSRIALIDTTTLSLQRLQIMTEQQATESSSPDITAQVASLRTQIGHWQNETDRQERLFADGATTRKQLDDARTQLRTLRDQLSAQLSTLGKNRSSISDNAIALQYRREQVEDQINRCKIISPINGTVLIKYAEPGEFATPGKPLLKLADLNDIYLRSYFTASQLADLKIGQKVTVVADFGADERYDYPGTITWIAEESEFTPKSIQTNDSRANLVYAVKIAVKNDGRLKLGQYGEVRL
ncbi:MAG: HlyD family efflux transporter periplasmic adaptor subunit [Duncaniella sp.]|uniref:HlyD family secretion protein n=1 Tax=Duncaniella sp. TaxID=2518496 RepID=UPI0023C180B1|nr:HlyD family efflux transporter periplasmic adaptor subunit [Duncaniella sp.]MDE6091107.1 HlyD family efflux transporter periplasmic adaptor subunit [Duncaniella sp.]